MQQRTFTYRLSDSRQPARSNRKNRSNSAQENSFIWPYLILSVINASSKYLEESIMSRLQYLFNHCRQTVTRCHWIHLLILTWMVSLPLTIQALEPPTPQQIQRYREDGTLARRIQLAKSYGNHRMSPALAANIKYKLQQLALQTNPDLKIHNPAKLPPSGWRNMPTTGTVHVPVFLVAFADYPPYNEAADIEFKVAGDGLEADYPRESLHDYYDRASYGQLDIQADVIGWYTTDYNRDAIATVEVESDRAAREALLREVFEFYDEDVDYSVYDNDGNGTIDYFAIIWTGPHGEWSTFWWGYQTHFSDGAYLLDGVRLDAYSWQWESRNYPDVYDPETLNNVEFQPSTLIHETGHALGLPDYYDYDASVGPDGGVGGLDMMDATWGDHNCFSKWVLDWITPQVLTQGAQQFTLSSAASTGDAVVIMPNIEGDTPFDEFFMVQNRYRELNDTGYPEDGLLIWHVNAELYGNGYDYVYDNSYTEFKLLRLMEADGLEQIELDQWADAGDYYTEGETFSPLSTPNSNNYAGELTRVWVTSISSSGPEMTFTAMFQGYPAYLPHFDVTDGYWETRLTLTNETDLDLDVEVEVFDNEGVLTQTSHVNVPGNGGLSQPLTELLGLNLPNTGWLRLGSQGQGISGLMTFKYLPKEAFTSLPLTFSGGTKLTYPLIEYIDGRSTGFAVVNLTEQQAEISLRLVRMDGNTAAVAFESIPPHGKLVDMVESVFSDNIPERSILKIFSDQKITGFALTLSSGNTNVVAVPATVVE